MSSKPAVCNLPCLGYLATAEQMDKDTRLVTSLLKHHDQGSLQKKSLFRLTVPERGVHHDGEKGQQAAGSKAGVDCRALSS